MTNQELAKLAISNENTPELGQYWQKRYEKFLKNNVFILSEKTQTLLGQKEQIDSPATPYGYINLPVFLGKNKIVDEVMLQNCIETSIRFLDSILDIINFTSEAKQLINQNRKIGLGIINFEEYLANREASSKVEEIDYLGEIISSSSYRASEALAEEKGPCDNWENLAFIIRPKAFEYWYNSDTGEVKSGLDISEEFTSTNLLSSHFEIIPRRNSNILLYPNDVEWQIWSDRDDNSIISQNAGLKMEELQAPIISTGQDDDNDYMPSFEQDKPQTALQADQIRKNETQVSNHPLKDEIKVSQEQFVNPTPISDLPLINPISTLQKKISNWFAIDPNLESTKPINQFDLSKNQENQIQKTDNNLLIPTSKKLTNQLNKNVESILEKPLEPIIEIKQVIREVEIIKEVKVPVVEIKEVIKEVEVVKEIIKPIFVQIVALSDEAKHVLVDQNNCLPIVEYSYQNDMEQNIIQTIDQNYHVKIDFMEISSVDLFENQVYIVYQAKIQSLGINNSILHFDFVEALHKEQDTVAYSKSIDRVHRWQQSSRIKAQELLKEYNQNIQEDANNSESKIIIQKNLFIEELQIRIKKLIDENSTIESQKELQLQALHSNFDKSIKAKEIIIKDISKEIQNTKAQLERAIQEKNRLEDDKNRLINSESELKLKINNLLEEPVNINLQPTKSKIEKVIIPILEKNKKDEELILVKNDDLNFDLNHTKSINSEFIPTININTNTMSQNQNIQTDKDANQAAFEISRNKMFMPTLEIETKLGVPVIIKNIQSDDEQPQNNSQKITDNIDPKSSSHAANVLLKLKRLTR